MTTCISRETGIEPDAQRIRIDRVRNEPRSYPVVGRARRDLDGFPNIGKYLFLNGMSFHPGLERMNPASNHGAGLLGLVVNPWPWSLAGYPRRWRFGLKNEG